MHPSRTCRSAVAWFVAAALAATVATAAEGPWQRNDHSAVRLITPYDTASRSGEFWFGVEFELAPHWHVYWVNSGDAGYPPALDLEATPEVTDAGLLFPAPERFHLPGGLLAFGYEDVVIYPVRASIDAPLTETGDSLEVAVNVDYVVCEVECIPFNYDLSLTQPLGDEALEDPLQAPRIAAWRGRLPTPGSRLASEIKIVDGEGRLQVEIPFAADDLFFVPQDLLILGEPSILPIEGGSRAEISVSRLDVGKALPATLDVEWTATATEGSDASPGQTGVLEVAVPVAWQEAGEGAMATATPVEARPGALWWIWLPVVLAAVCALASGALTAPPNLLRTAWIAGIFLVGGVWYLATRAGGGEAVVSMPVVTMGAWVLTLVAVLAFAGRRLAGPVAMGLAAAAATFSVLPAAPGIGWIGAALLLLAVIAARPQRESPSTLLLGVAGFLAMLAVVARFYLLSGSLSPTSLAGIQIGLLASAAGTWMVARGRRTVSRGIGWALVAAGGVCVVYFVV